MGGMCSAFCASLPYSSSVGPNIMTPMPPMGLNAPARAISSSRIRACLRVSPPPPPQRLPKAIGVTEVENLLAAPDPETPAGLRARAFLELLYATGARISEAVALDVAYTSRRDSTDTLV